MNTDEITKLEQRITNLEIALHAVAQILNQMTPPSLSEELDELLSEHHAAATELGGCRRTNFVR